MASHSNNPVIPSCTHAYRHTYTRACRYTCLPACLPARLPAKSTGTREAWVVPRLPQALAKRRGSTVPLEWAFLKQGSFNDTQWVLRWLCTAVADLNAHF